MASIDEDIPTAASTNHIKNVIVVGAAGQLGQHITASLLGTGKHSVTALTRPDSKSTFPQGVKAVKVSYDDHESLVRAMRGQDALVVTMNVLAQDDPVTKLVEAAIEAEVPWILPNEWGTDYTNPEINRETMLGNDKLEIRRLIESKNTNTSWIAVACGFWYDYSLAAGLTTFGFDFAKKEVIFYDDGELKIYCSTLPYCGIAVAKILSLPIQGHGDNNDSTSLEQYKNHILRVSAFHINQKDMLASVLRVTGEKEVDWTVKYESSESRYSEGKKILQGGDRWGYRQMLYSRMFYPSNPLKRPEDYSDERLGLQKPVLDVVTKWALDKAESEKNS